MVEIMANAPLAADQINKKTIEDLELAFSVDMYTTRGLEASPIVVDGILYMTGSWSVVYAVDAQTGEEIWSYDPEVPGDWARKACCDVVNRGVAVYDGAVYVASLDGYLISLNAETGEEIWRVNTIIDRTRAYTINDNWRGFQPACCVHIDREGEFQIFNGLLIDLGQRRVALFAIISTIR